MRAWLAGPAPSARDRKEFHLMGAEKVAAFYESWGAMMMEGYLASWRLLASPQWWLSPGGMSSHYGDTALGLLNHGLAPLHRRAGANRSRLRRVRL